MKPKVDKTIIELLGQLNKAQVEHMIMDNLYNLLYFNNGVESKQFSKMKETSKQKCYEVYGNKEPCKGCKLKEAIRCKKPMTWESAFKNIDGIEIKKEITVYPTFNKNNEVEKIVSVRLENREYGEENMVEIFSCIADSKEASTKGHAENVYNLCKALGKEMNLTTKQQKELEMAARLHDIGNIVIPDELLGKEQEISPEERKIIRKHPIYSEEILQRIKAFEGIGRIVRHHHEKYNGKGYPDKLHGEEIPLEARIIAVADAYDAMSNHRVYKEAMTEKEIVKEMVQKAGTQFDPKVVRAFLNVLSKIKK